jgi:hypothetical protein
MLDLFVARFPAYPSDAGAGKNDPDTISFVRKITAGLLSVIPQQEPTLVVQGP